MLVFDFRNHGQNVPVEPPTTIIPSSSAISSASGTRSIPGSGKKTTIGIFHSMSARTAMKHAIEIGWRWDGLVLFDPPNVPPVDHPRYRAMEIFENKLTEWALGRRRRFAAVEELANEYRQSRATQGWVPGAHELMARSVLRKSPDGDGYVLVCAPENEAAIYAEALTLNLWPRASEFGGPVKLIGADPNLKGAPATARPTKRSGPRTATTTTSSPAPATSCRSKSRRNARVWSTSSSRNAGSARAHPDCGRHRDALYHSSILRMFCSENRFPLFRNMR